MKNFQEIDEVLSKMIELLRFGGVTDWAGALERVASSIVSDPDASISQVLAMFGGMGSLNDIVLYANGQPLAIENSEFDELRSRLYYLCHEHGASHSGGSKT